jgi:GrpB-like predicted nucleotidyltransferase (UPF0157 family)
MQNNISLKTYQKTWVSDYEILIHELCIFLDLSKTDSFEHMGSTAVPGLLSKPTIDVLLGVDRIKNFSQKNVRALQNYGFDYVSILEEETPYRKYFQLIDVNNHHLAHLHVVTKNGHFWHQHLLFRNYLLKNPQAVAAYAAVKKQAILQAKTRDEYTALKTRFVFESLRNAFFDRELNRPLANQGDLEAFVPQSYMTAVIAQLSLSEEDVRNQVAEWDCQGIGPLWWLKAGKVTVA